MCIYIFKNDRIIKSVRLDLRKFRIDKLRTDHMNSELLINDQRDNLCQRENTSSNKILKSETPVPCMEDILMKQLMQFYTLDFNRNQMLPIILGHSELSLRVLDWFVTNYAKQYNIIYSIKKQTRLRQSIPG